MFSIRINFQATKIRRRRRKWGWWKETTRFTLRKFFGYASSFDTTDWSTILATGTKYTNKYPFLENSIYSYERVLHTHKHMQTSFSSRFGLQKWQTLRSSACVLQWHCNHNHPRYVIQDHIDPGLFYRYLVKVKNVMNKVLFLNSSRFLEFSPWT